MGNEVIIGYSFSVQAEESKGGRTRIDQHETYLIERTHNTNSPVLFTEGGAPYVAYGARTVSRVASRAVFGTVRRTDREAYGTGAFGVSKSIKFDTGVFRAGAPGWQ